jgi:hypothetical protein
MHPMLIVLAAASQLIYEAQGPSFGCNSTADVTELQHIRTNAKAFQQRLFEQYFYGECIAIAPGAVVDGTVEGDEPNKVLRVLRDRDPPGYMAPLADFKVKGNVTLKAGEKSDKAENKAADKPKTAEQPAGSATKP